MVDLSLFSFHVSHYHYIAGYTCGRHHMALRGLFPKIWNYECKTLSRAS